MTADLTHRYGPWAVVAGASDGLGAAWARAMAQRGISVVLVARRKEMLDALADEIRAGTGVQARVLPVDLAAEGAAAEIARETADIEVGMLMYCAGADPRYARFLDSPSSFATSLVQRNCVVPVQLCHHFAAPMAARGRGAIVVVGSAAGLVGAAHMVAYGASKAFDMVLAEGLWAELHPAGVDVLGAILGATDTPALRRLLADRGVLASPDDPSPIPGALTAEEAVDEIIAALPDGGPTHFVGERTRLGAAHLAGMSRGDAVRFMASVSGGTMQGGSDRQGGSDPSLT
jgi:short-subunit dehydrogenase